MATTNVKPKGKVNAYFYFVSQCRNEHKKNHPNETLSVGDFSRSCSERWKNMGTKERKPFQDLADADKIRYAKEMKLYCPPKGEKKRRS